MNTLCITQCFCNADILEHSMSNLYNYSSGNFEHWFLLKHYPINEKENTEKILEYAKKYNAKVFDCGGDIGIHEGLNKFFRENPQPKGSRFFGFDPDTLVQSKNFDIAMNEVMNEASNIGILALSNAGVNYNCGLPIDEVIIRKFNDLLKFKKVIAGHGVIMHPSVDMMNCCMIDIDLIMDNGGFSQPLKYYGFIEVRLHEIMRKNNKLLGYLIDFKEAYDGILEQYKHDEYRQWKGEHLGGYQGSLKEWIIKNGKESIL